MNGKSRTFDIQKIKRTLTSLSNHFTADRITVYAGQASFLLISSSIPFIALLFSLSGCLFPDTIDALTEFIVEFIPDTITKVFADLKAQIISENKIQLLSVSTVTSLWVSSKSLRSIVRGISNIYDTENTPGYLKNSLYSLLFTTFFLILILAVLTILAFGVTIASVSSKRFPELRFIFSVILHTRGFVFFVILTLFFSLLYYGVAKGILRSSGSLMKYSSQLPGAALCAAGWMIFSYCYSVYLNYFPRASYFYGSLAAVMLLFVWVYFCMIMLLSGAEINKLLCR